MSLPISMSDVPWAPIYTTARQSPPLDLRKPYSDASIKGKHVVITGGASGFGAGYVRRWAALGASIVIGDVNAAGAEQLVAEVRRQSGNDSVWFVRCDVREWQQQVELFREAVRLSPHKGIDAVVANAGVAGEEPLIVPSLDSADQPKKPDFRTVDVNLYGVLYTAHLALYWLARNPGSSDADPQGDAARQRDRHLLLIGSFASMVPLVSGPLYSAAKHGVMGLFRSLRCNAFASGVRVNMLCPYFIDTPIIPLAGKLLLAGSGAGQVESVVEGATRLTADASICGRCLAVGPKVAVKQQDDGEWTLVSLARTGSRFRPVDAPSDKSGDDAFETALWEALADDMEQSDAFTFRFVSLLNAVHAVRGRVGIVTDVLRAFFPFLKR